MRNHYCLLAGAIAFFSTMAQTQAFATNQMPSRQEMWQIIQQQQQQIEALNKKLGIIDNQVKKVDTKVQETDMKVEATAQAVEEKSVSGTPNWFDKTSIGGYGEMHYNNGSAKDEIDFHRFVLFVNHEFNDDIRMFSELELEHSISGQGQPGEIELEQAFLQFDLLDDQYKAQVGLFVLPVGILNEVHEPATFYGVERNPVENRIIPTTWWEGGVSLTGLVTEGLQYDLAVHSGLKVNPANFTVRGGRQKVANAQAEAGAVTGRIKYNPTPGISVAYTGQYQQDVLQNTGTSGDASAWFNTAHIDYNQDGFGLRALYARWDIDNSVATALGADEQYGFYLEPSYRFTTSAGDVGFFGRYNRYDNNAGNSTDSAFDQYDFGVNFWPHPQVVLKADYNFVQAPQGQKDDTIFNLGVGYNF